MANHASGSTPLGFDDSNDRRDDLFDALSDAHRRVVLRALHAADSPLSVADLADEIRTRQSPSAMSVQSLPDPTRIQTTLVHDHLPRLADAGLISYDRIDKTVSSTERGDDARLHLRPTPGR